MFRFRGIKALPRGHFLFHHSFATFSIINDSISVLLHPKTNTEIYLVGSNHSSKESVKLVEEVASIVRPTTIAVELCEERLVDYGYFDDEELEKSYEIPALRSSKLANLPDCKFFYYRLAEYEFTWAFYNSIFKQNNIQEEDVGGEMQYLLDYARGRELPIICLDRDNYELVVNTLACWREYLFNTKNRRLIKLLGSRRTLTRAEQTDYHKILKENLPNIYHHYVEVRDMIMAEKLLLYCSQLSSKQKIVAAVGLAHLPGIEKHWHKNSISSNYFTYSGQI